MKTQNKKNLARLLKEAQAGNSSSLHSLCKELEDYIRGYFQQQFKNNTIVDDLCQETYLRLLRNLLQIRDDMKLKSFVAKVALHVTQDHFRQKYRTKEENLEISYQNEEESDTRLKLGVQSEITDSQSDSIINKIDLQRALDRIPEKSRKILVMKSQGYRYEEISAEVGLTVSGVKMQIKRGLEQLRSVLLNVTFLLVNATLIIERIHIN